MIALLAAGRWPWKRAKGAAAVAAPKTTVVYEVEVHVGAAVRVVRAVSSEPAPIVCACVRRAHGGDIAYAYADHELVGFDVRGSGVR